MFLATNIAFVLAFIFYILSILIHVLVIKKVIPYHYVNGGRSTSYEEQKDVSVKSIAVLLVLFLFVIIGLVFPSTKESFLYMIIGFTLTAFFMFGTIMQLLGSPFERYLVSIINLLGVLAHLGLALHYFV
ncbi:MAG: hypothetical protein V2J89_17460 [Halieaceae bacterium]|jgi:hypothetical protein|nr:hypothetical protein [Halieaceae bacterium]